MVGEQSRNTSHRDLHALFESKFNDAGKQFTSRINLGSAVKATAESILRSKITILTKSVDKRI